MRAHEAGALHAEGYRGPAWLQTPVDVNALVPSLWATSVGRGSDGVLTVGGVSVTELAREFGTPAYVIDEDDFRSRARDFKQTYAEVFDDLCGGADVFYAGKAFLCTEVARWVHEEGLHLDVVHRRRARRRACAPGVPGERIGLHGNNKSDRRDPRRPRRTAWAASSSTPSRRSSGSPAVARRARRSSPRRCWSASRSASRRTPTSSSPPRTRTRSSGSRSAGGHAARGRSTHPRPARGAATCSGCTATSARRSSTPAGFEVAARRVRRPARADRRASRGRAARARPRRRLRHRVHVRARPAARRRPRRRAWPSIVARECRAEQVAVPRDLRRAGARDRRTEHLHPLRGRHRQAGRPRRRRPPRTYVSVDGGMSDNIRTALYDADYSCTAGEPGTRAPQPRAGPRRGQALRERRHRRARTSSSPPTSRPATWSPCPAPAPTAGAGEPVQPHAAAAGRRRPGRRGPRHRPARDRWTTCSPSTSADADRVEARSCDADVRIAKQ